MRSPGILGPRRAAESGSALKRRVHRTNSEKIELERDGGRRRRETERRERPDRERGEEGEGKREMEAETAREEVREPHLGDPPPFAYSADH